MAKIKIRERDDLKSGDCDASETPSIGVATFPIFASHNDNLHARFHDLIEGSSLGWQAGKTGFVVYVWHGTVHAGDVILPKGSAMIIEHGAGAAVHADENATLLVFNANPDTAERPTRLGGNVHLLPAERVPAATRVNEQMNVGGALFADAECSTCELWLHANDFHDPDCLIPNHFHSEDEIIVVTSGEIVLGTRHYGRGTAIAIAHNTIYGFKTGPEGLGFINFRPSWPTYGLAGQAQTSDERSSYSTLPSPDYINL